ncbi:MAG: V-type ATP synthase subunit I, partial [Bacillota bacterium]
EEDEDITTVVDNPRVVEPFELITDLYSPPGKNDIDPNLTMAPFFFLSFGMMISDAGYGIVLMILSYLGLKKIRPEGQGKKLFELIFWGGLATFIWGAIYGGWFGELIGLPALWIRPLNDPISILILSFVVGGIQIFAGLGLQAYKKIKNDRVMAAVFDEGFWMIFLIGFVLFVFPRTAPYAHYVVIAGAVLLVLTQGRERKNPLAKVGAGLLSLYDVTTYLSDVLSYSRIMALGLATGVIATVVNTMGDLIAVNIVGYIAMIVVMLVGHLFNIAVNSLGAYVHTSRLQYVEFFSKFYEGGGRSLDPLAIKTNYIKYKQGEEKI